MISDSIPIELILEILLRLPSKSIARFHCVSKLWASVLDGPYFTELFLTRSSARPRLLFAIHNKRNEWSIFSLPQHLSPYEKSLSSSLVVTAEFHMKSPPDYMRNYTRKCGYASGLICFEGLIKENDYCGVPVICNPITGRYAALPYLQSYNSGYSFFGFDPIDKQYKVLSFMAKYSWPSSLDRHKILTLGTGQMRWRRKKCILRHDIKSEGICINGVLYYLGLESKSRVIVCFDVRSEKFKFIYLESFCEQLINYKGKLGMIYSDRYGYVIEFRVWVLEDAEKQEWSKYAYTLSDDAFFDKYNHVVGVGVTVTGEIVFSMAYFTSENPFYVFYFNPEEDALQRVEIQGFDRYHEEHRDGRVYGFTNQVEDLNINDPKLLKSSIFEDREEEESEEGDDEEESKIETSIVVL